MQRNIDGVGKVEDIFEGGETATLTGGRCSSDSDCSGSESIESSEESETDKWEKVTKSSGETDESGSDEDEEDMISGMNEDGFEQ